MLPANPSSISSSDAPSSLPLLLSVFHSIHFSKRLHGFEYLYCCDHVQIILEGVEILPNVYTFLSWAPDSWERQTDCGDRLCREAGQTGDAKHGIRLKDNDMGARSVLEDVRAGWRIMRRSGRLWTIS